MTAEHHSILQKSHLGRISEAIQTASPDTKTLSLGRRSAIAIRKVYENLHKGDEKPYSIPQGLEERLIKEQAFQEAVGSVQKELDTLHLSPLQNRELKTEVIISYWLFVAGGVDQLYAKYIEKHGLVPPDQTEDIKISLAAKYLGQKVRATHELPDGVSQGFEMEGKTDAALQQTNDMFYWLDASNDASSSIQTRRTIRQKSRNLYTALMQAGFQKDSSILAGLDEGVPVTSNLASLSVVLKDPIERGNLDAELKEYKTYPAFSYKLQMREYVYLKRSLLEYMTENIQRTSAVELSREHTEVMAFKLIGEAAGFLPNPFTSEDIATFREEEKMTYIYNEITAKISDDGNYYPYWRAKNPKTAIPYPKKQPKVITEERAINRFKEGSFIGLVRYARLRALGDICIAAKQTAEKKRTAREKELVIALDGFLSGWSELLQTHTHETMPKSEDFGLYRHIPFGRFKKGIGAKEMYKGKTAYELLRNKIRYMTFMETKVDESTGRNVRIQTDFTKDVRKLVTEFSKQVRKIEASYGRAI